MFQRIKIVLLLMLIAAFILPNFQGLTVNTSNVFAQVEGREILEAELEKLLKQIVQYEENIDKTEEQKRTLRNQIYILRNRIGKLDAQIRKGNIVIRDLGVQIQDTEFSIEETSLKIEDSREKLGAILRAVQREDRRSFVEVFFAGETLSDFFNNLIALETLNIENKRILGQIESLKFFLEGQKDIAIGKKRTTRDMVAIQLFQKEEGVKMRREQGLLLKMTEAEFEQYKREKAKAEERVAEIRARLFPIIGLPDRLTFGEAYELAKWVENLTGIRPAFLLSIWQQESNIFGRLNVGRCNVVDKTSGRTRHIRTGQVFSRGIAPGPPRHHRRNDLSALFKITAELGKDTFTTQISCPIPGVGWGGAMGPAQFIPTTWIGVRDDVKAVLGRPANPWILEDAFLASGIYLKRLGGVDNEFRAAMRYYSGGHWTRADEILYGMPVMARAERFQKDINILERN